MEQRSLDFYNDESHALYLQLDKEQQRSLSHQMTLLIIAVFQAQEKTHHDQPQQSNQD